MAICQSLVVFSHELNATMLKLRVTSLPRTRIPKSESFYGRPSRHQRALQRRTNYRQTSLTGVLGVAQAKPRAPMPCSFKAQRAGSARDPIVDAAREWAAKKNHRCHFEALLASNKRIRRRMRSQGTLGICPIPVEADWEDSSPI